jgi:hypothetical protein
VSPATRVLHVKGCEIEGGGAEGLAEAVNAATQADAVVLVVGESADMSGEAASRSVLDLPGRQLELVRAVHGAGKPTAVVLVNGRPLTIGWLAENVPAILEAWQGGTEAGHAAADVLFGDVNPGGKLPITFPRSVGQVPIYYARKNTGRPPGAEKWTSKYLDVPVTPQFPFGHGLSYTTFELSGLKLDAARIAAGGRVGVEVTAKNTGARAGDEVVQVYVTDVAASVTRPVKQLRAFERVSLKPGESRTLSFTLGPEDLGLLDARLQWAVEPGQFRITAATSSEGGLTAGLEVRRSDDHESKRDGRGERRDRVGGPGRGRGGEPVPGRSGRVQRRVDALHHEVRSRLHPPRVRGQRRPGPERAAGRDGIHGDRREDGLADLHPALRRSVRGRPLRAGPAAGRQPPGHRRHSDLDDAGRDRGRRDVFAVHAGRPDLGLPADAVPPLRAAAHVADLDHR